MRFDPLALFEILRRHEVGFVVIGGIAAAAYGSPSVTQDLDICYSRDRDNLQRLAEALQEMKAQLRGGPPNVGFQLDAKSLEMGDHFTFSTVHGDFDCLGHPAGSDGYEDLTRGAETMDFEGVRVAIASINDLIRMKRASGRPKDRAELEILGALREEIDRPS